jgi:hypothetical protein
VSLVVALANLIFFLATNKQEELVLDERASSVLSSALGEIRGTVLMPL